MRDSRLYAYVVYLMWSEISAGGGFMGQKDMAEKIMEDYPDVFADIVNVLLFDGKQVISEEDLKETGMRSQFKADTGRIHEEERDVGKYWVRDGALQEPAFRERGASALSGRHTGAVFWREALERESEIPLGAVRGGEQSGP